MIFKSFKNRTGQALFLLLTLLIAMAALGLWILDIHTFVIRRLRTQDGGDAAALAAARWQAAGLNLCGELNLIQAYMLADTKENVVAAQALHELRLRIQLTTPILAAQAAQTVARENGLSEVPGGAKYVREYQKGVILDDFYEGAEDDLQEMLHLLAQEPIYAVPLSGIFEESDFYNYLLDEAFYEAILSRNWCWFYKKSFLRSYQSSKDFGPLPKMRTTPFFDLRLTSLHSSLDSLSCINTLSDQLQSIGHPPIPPRSKSPIDSMAKKERFVDHIRFLDGDSVPILWTIYKESDWGEWHQMTSGELPIRGTLHDCYDYTGANIAVSVQKGETTWIATAKAFGKVNEENPTIHEMVLGGFEAVRLIPVDAADVTLYDFNFAWLNHIRNHLFPYLQRGRLKPGCKYCTALERWDNPEFRHNIISWLAKYGHTCPKDMPGGPSDRGGTRYGH